VFSKWQSGLAVHMKQAPFRSVGAQVTVDPEVQAAKPSDRAVARLKQAQCQNFGESCSALAAAGVQGQVVACAASAAHNL